MLKSKALLPWGYIILLILYPVVQYFNVFVV